MSHADRRLTWHDPAFLDGVRGSSFLHIGCGSGELCREALEQGAASATGIDINVAQIRQGEGHLTEANADAHFIQADFEQWEAPPQSFDIAVCANLLHHFYDPVGAVRKIMQLTKRRFYLVLAPGLPRSARMGSVFALAQSLNWPVVTLSDRPAALRAADHTFTMTRSALEVIINRHSTAFEPVRWLSRTGGWIAEVRRRQIDHLVVVAGATAVGKSTFIDRMGEPAMRARFGLADTHYEVVKPEETLAPGNHPGVIYHYNLLRPFGRALQTFERDPSFHLLQSAKRITVITLANTSEVLRKRMELRGEMPAPKWRDRRRNLKIAALAHPAFLAEWYGAWLKALGDQVGITDSHLILADENYTDLRSSQRLIQLVGTGLKPELELQDSC